MDSGGGGGVPKVPSGGGGEEGGGGIGGLMGSAGSKVGGFLAAYASVAALKAGFSRRESMAEEKMAIREVTNGKIDEGTMSLIGGSGTSEGYSGKESRERVAAIQKQYGAPKSKLWDIGVQSAQIQRGYGITGEEQGAFMGASTHAGGAGSNNPKMIANAIGAAVTAGISASNVSRYLQSMSGYLESMSQGVNVDQESLNGIAGSMGSLPFFKADPQRIFTALGDMNQAFKSGDRFQQAQSMRTIQGVAPGASVGAMQNRMAEGLFGQASAESLSAVGYKPGTPAWKAMMANPQQLMHGMTQQALAGTDRMSPEDREQTFRNRMGMQNSPDAAREILGKALHGGAFTSGDVKKFKTATMDPTARLSEVMVGVDGEIKTLTGVMSHGMDEMIDILTLIARHPLGGASEEDIQGAGKSHKAKREEQAKIEKDAKDKHTDILHRVATASETMAKLMEQDKQTSSRMPRPSNAVYVHPSQKSNSRVPK
jgi:hypothetical protein